MQHGWKYAFNGSRDLRIDWLRGLAMTCVIVDHSRLSSLFSWFSYERFWVVTAAEVFVVLSGVVFGTVYGKKLARSGWRVVLKGLGRRIAVLYFAFVAVAVSVVLLAHWGVDITAVTAWTSDDGSVVWTLPWTLDAGAWSDILLMRSGPWAFEIIGLYVWLLVAAAPCLLALRRFGWRTVLGASWALYFLYRIAPYQLTSGHFEATFPLLAWQLLFVHGAVIGYHREDIAALLDRCHAVVPCAVALAAAGFAAFALSNPWADGPSWLHWSIVSPERFEDMYFRYFTLSDLGVGRLLNLAVGLPIGYALLTWGWRLVRPLGLVFIPLGRGSLGAFILHVYGLLLLAYLPAAGEELWPATIVQIALVVAIVCLLSAGRRVMARESAAPPRRAAAVIAD